MAQPVKHVGEYKGKKVVIAYRTVPNEETNALVIPTERLNPSYHDELFSVVDSQQAQDAYEIATVLAVRKFSDGNNMLSTMHTGGNLVKVPTAEVTVTPTPNKSTWLSLSDLNQQIADQRGVTISELSIKAENNTDPALTDKDIARNYRAQADRLYKEVLDLRRRADEIDSPKKSTSKETVKA